MPQIWLGAGPCWFCHRAGESASIELLAAPVFSSSIAGPQLQVLPRLQVLKELEEMGIPATGTTDATLAATAVARFAGRTLNDYYTYGRGSGLAQQDLETFTLMTTSTVLVNGASDVTVTDRGNYSVYANAASMRGPVSEVNGKEGSPVTGARQLIANSHGMPVIFDTRDITDGGMVVGWNHTLGCYPWQAGDILTGRLHIKSPRSCVRFNFTIVTMINRTALRLYRKNTQWGAPPHLHTQRSEL